MMYCGARTRLVIIIVVALTVVVASTRFLIPGRLESLPPAQAPEIAEPSIGLASDAETDPKQYNAVPRVPCTGPRGLDLQESDDHLHESTINIRKSPPQP